MNKIEKEQAERMTKELIKYSKKCNAMMMASVEGEAPQILKMFLLKKLVDEYFERIKKMMPKESIEAADKLAKQFIENIGKIGVTKNKEDVVI